MKNRKSCKFHRKSHRNLQYSYLDYLYKEVGLTPEDIENVPESGSADCACFAIASKKYVRRQFTDIPTPKLYDAVRSLCDEPELNSRRQAIAYLVWMTALNIKEERFENDLSDYGKAPEP